MTPVQQRVTVRSAGVEGAYHRLVLETPLVAERARPGQFLALAVGEEPTAMLLRRCFSIAAARAGGVELLVAAAGPGSTWLTRRRPGDRVDLVGPLGGPFPDPAPGAGCVLVGGGYGAAPMLWWASELLGRGHPVALVLGAATEGRLAGVEAARALAAEVHVATDDGSAGQRGRVTEVLGAAIASVAARSVAPPEVYGCGPMPMLRAVSELCQGAGARAWCAVEEAMACGIGVCMTCVLPVRTADGGLRMSRTCTDGPTFDGSTIAWDEIGKVVQP
jgi:dihydroorotate dehydrogenase electron transfer subunit